MILAIDTGGGAHASVAALDRAGQLTETHLYAPDGHSSQLFDAITALLDRAGMKLDEVECFAAASGPGSFTGVRVALSAAKGLAATLDRPMVAVSTLRALAWFGSAPLRAVIADGRRGDIFGAVYGSAAREPVLPECVTRLDAFLAALPAGAERITAGDAVPVPAPVLTVPPQHLSRAVAHLAREEFLAGRAVDPATVDANYIRSSDAELRWTDRG
ncbi:MAG: tRNA (adenosine(37)-N6)-threonylcarbamoyltransferase complex dimerization subunit type 1 TsaB [Acidobacteria bacterium]|nr:tRNA (adenosine(37)-N6)-threonylcarbamoyltransferase complex dimerization subunit type 1 TsaB [Acidobacteriota bacterium]